MTNAANSSANHTPVKVGLVGYGWWGKTIARQIANSQWLQLCAVAEIDNQARTAMQSDPALANIAVYESPEKLMAHGSLDAVILCTPHQQHAQQMLLAAQAGLHVFCEKPLCLTWTMLKNPLRNSKLATLFSALGMSAGLNPKSWPCVN